MFVRELKFKKTKQQHYNGKQDIVQMNLHNQFSPFKNKVHLFLHKKQLR